MRTHTQAFKDEIKQFGREFKDLLYYTANGSTLHYNNEHINSVNYSYDTSLLKSVMQTLTFDSDLDLEVGNTIDYRLSLVGVTGSELQFNNFTITKKEEQKDTHSYLYTCNDNMIKSMTDYVSLNVTYPITIRNYINAICTHLGITFKNASDIFINYNQEITSEHYLDSDGHSLGYTFRDVLDDLAEATGGFICIDNNGALEIRYPINTNDTINEEYFQDNNVNIGKKYGPINVVTLSRNGVDNLVRPSTLPTTITEIKIENNPILDQTNREDFIDGIYNNLNGLEFYLNDFQTLGILYYEVGDLYNVSIDNTTYKCLMLNDNIIRDSGLTENIYTDEPTTSVTDYKYASDTDKLEKTSRNAYFLADKANGVAEMIVEGIGSNGQVTGASVIASINDDESNLTLNADKINLNGAVTANNNFVINQDGSVTINNGTISLYDDGQDSQHPVIMITESGTTEWTSAFYSSGMSVNSSNAWGSLAGPNLYLAQVNNYEVTRWTSITPGYDEDSAIKCGYGNTTNFEVSNHQSGSYLTLNGGANIRGDVELGSVKSKNLLNNLVYDLKTSGVEYVVHVNKSIWIDSQSKAWASVQFLQRYIPINTSLTFSCTFTADGNANNIIYIYDANDNTLASSNSTSATSGNISFTFTTPTPTIKIRFSANASSSTIQNTVLFSNLMIEEGSVATSYGEYQPLNGEQIYSFAETKVGYWINGKFIYRRVVTFTPSTSTLETSIAHNISNVDEILPTSSCLLYRTSNQFVPFSMAYPSSANNILAWSMGWQATKTQIYTWIGSNMRAQMDTSRGYGAIAILEYTKTTD